jgi:hypothetical protein
MSLLTITLTVHVYIVRGKIIFKTNKIFSLQSSIKDKTVIVNITVRSDILLPYCNVYSGVPRNFFQGGGQQIQLRTEDRENGDLGVVASKAAVLGQL